MFLVNEMANFEPEPESEDSEACSRFPLSSAPCCDETAESTSSLRCHPAIHPTLPDYRSYIDIDFDGGPPKNPLIFLRYTPVTVRAEELLRHYNVDYRELGITEARPIANMFDTDFYRRFFHGKVKEGSFRLRFVSNPEQHVKIMITITIASYIQGSSIIGFTSTLFSLMECIKDCCDRGSFVWNDFVICAVIDGRREFSIENPDGPRSLLTALQHMGLYYNVESLWEDGAALDSCKRLFAEDREARRADSLTVDHGQKVYMHIFETVAQLGGESFPPLQIMVCVKEFAGISSASHTISRRPECHLWALEGIARHFATVSDSKDLQVVLLDCGICPEASALLQFSDFLNLDKVAIVSGDTLSDSNHQIPVFPSPQIVALNPALATFLMQRRIEDLIDGASETALGGNSTRVNVAMCALRLDRVQTDRYFASLTRTGSKGPDGPLRCNMYISDDRMLPRAAARGCRVEMVIGARAQASRLSQKSVSASAEAFTFCNLIELTRRSSTTFFMSLMNLYIGFRRYSCSWRGLLFFPFIIIPRLATWVMSVVAIGVLTMVIIAPLSILVPWARLPLAIILTALFTILVQLSIGCRDLSRGIQYAYMFAAIAVGFLWVVAIAYFMLRVILYEPRVNLVAWCILIAPYVLTPLASGNIDDMVVFLLCWFQWFCLLPTTLVLGSGLYAICQSDILPWGTPGAYPDDPATTETQARRMEIRSWLVVIGTMVNIAPVVAYSYYLAHPGHNRYPPGQDAASQVALAAIDVTAWGIGLPRLIGVILSLIGRLGSYWCGEGRVMHRRPKPVSQDPCRIYVRDVLDGLHRVPVVTMSSQVGTMGSNTAPSLKTEPEEWLSMASQGSLFLPVPNNTSVSSFRLSERSRHESRSSRAYRMGYEGEEDGNERSSNYTTDSSDDVASASQLSSVMSDSDDTESMDFIPGPTSGIVLFMKRLESLLSSVFGRKLLLSENMHTTSNQCFTEKPIFSPLKIATWNVGSVQTNPLEFWDDSDHRFTDFLGGFQDTAEALEAAGVSVGDFLEDTLPFNMKSSLLDTHQTLSLPSAQSVADAYDFLRAQKIWSGFLTSKTIGNSRIISWPDRFTNVDYHGQCRPSMISCYSGDLSLTKDWFDRWIRFMSGTPIPPLDVEKYKVETPYKDNYRAMSIVGLAIFDALLIAVSDKAFVDWRTVRENRIASVVQRPQQLVSYIDTRLLGSADVIMLQEVSRDIQEAILSSQKAEEYQLLEDPYSGMSKQRSLILVRRGCGFEVDTEASEKVRVGLSSEATHRGLASGDLTTCIVEDSDGHSLLLASFHGDTNGRLTVPTLKLLTSLDLPLMVGMDANCYATATVGNLVAADFLKEVSSLGLVHTDARTTTSNRRTPLQAQAAKVNVLDENPKDYILLTGGGMRIRESSIDNGDSPGRALPNLHFPSDHALVRAEADWAPQVHIAMARYAYLIFVPLFAEGFSEYNAHLECPGGIDDCLTEDFFREFAAFQATYMREDLNLSQHFLTSIYQLCVEPYLDRVAASGENPKCPAPLADIMLNALLALEARFGGTQEARLLYQRAVDIVMAAIDAGDLAVKSLTADWEMDTPYTYPTLLDLAPPSPVSLDGLTVYVYEPPHEIFAGLVQSPLLCGMGQWGVEVLVHKWFLSNSNRTSNPEDADLFYVPVYGTCIQTRNGMGLKDMTSEVYEPLFAWLHSSPWWRRRNGADHIFLFADGQGAYQFSFYDIIRSTSILLLVEGRCPTWNEPVAEYLDVKQCYNPWKDIIIPGHTDRGRTMYMRQHAKPLKERDLLVTFHGRHGGVHSAYERCEVRNTLVRELTQYADVSVGGFVSNYLELKGRARFCIAPAGTSPWTNHLYESFFAGCVPVILSDEFILPFTDFLDWSQFSIRWPEQSISELYSFLKSVPDQTVSTLMDNVRAVSCWFDWWSEVEGCSPYVALARHLQKRASDMKHLGVEQNSLAGRFWHVPDDVRRSADTRKSRFHVYSDSLHKFLIGSIPERR
ncbi:hypothetical protein FOL47_003521 [Perkinsus chesapeaki]|uniref:Exostosin GT47 domain-containing protein n=1 Tax=Perkinsus chesapeaki TaxID=330153 RepID=A0A7J6N0W1_PERCH|nr:hypothetical protein FOL47_003521 [Perkinsus chesapeaki]